MPAAEYTTTAKLPLAAIWEFVSEMDNWAPYVTGYQSHRKESETDSVWVLKGDIGVMARRLEFRVHITEWNGPSRVAFELSGLNEPMKGSGSFEMSAYEEAGAGAAAAGPAPAKGLWLRLLEAVVRFFLRLLGGGRPERAASADAGPGAGMAKLRVRLEIEPGGPMAPMVSALMKPAMLPAAEQLAGSIMARLEETHAARS
jgi:carbon monoxide dehydrogenase subunit G